ncbi:MAG: hypothetical protein WD404_08060 [Solirubrobacterales bacterium]
MRSALAVLGAAAIGIALPACGSSEGGSDGADSGTDADRARIEALTERFGRVLAARDARAFCRLLAPNDVQKLGGKEAGRRRCLAVWGRKRNPLFRAEAPDFSVEDVSFQGSYATAQLANGGELGFAREGDRWYVHLAPEAGQ